MTAPTSTDTLPGWELLVSWVAVVEARSISEGARRLGVSQAGVSQHIKQLETQVGTTLLDRSTRPALPTASGQRLYDHAVALLHQAREMTEAVRHLSRSRRAMVRLGCVDSFAATVGPQLVGALAGSVSKLRLWSGLSPALDAQFMNRQLDLLVTTSDLFGEPRLLRLPLMTEAYQVVLPRAYADVVGCSLYELSRRLPLMRYSERSLLGRHIETYLQTTDPGIERSFEFDATDPLLSLVAAGMGFAITTPLCIWQSRQHADSIVTRPMSAFMRAGSPYATLSRNFYLIAREADLGTLPGEVRQLVQVLMRDLKRSIVAKLGIADDAIQPAASTPPAAH